ncbi:hypothetical protein NRL09_01610 [Aeromonas caviae]|uniref:hypothetical protein n=1 Tax=Aeromonas caviae TaxID=648 RepID=UPI0021D35E65|nr:hypothetical protein [Aeromonas caviae]MCU7795228.1 hypothetical protein [Aeromonas caviae]WAF60513.1 hypothetical protein NRL03_01610 [Aeromonas caviae]WAF81400.1 hypothetical protein NRL09_01610 [Aeromonas caviae]
MEPFKNPPTLKNIVGTYPDAAHIAEAVMSGGQFAKPGIQIISATLMDEWREVANC